MQGLMQDSKAPASCSCFLEYRAASYCKGLFSRSRTSPFWCARKQTQKLDDIGRTCMLAFWSHFFILLRLLGSLIGRSDCTELAVKLDRS
ncbi:hypothetical protein BDV12DRAFT_174522 [Aspergillus spectabilis]